MMTKKFFLTIALMFIFFGTLNYLCSKAFSNQNYSVTTDFGKIKNIQNDIQTMLIVDYSDSMNEYIGNRKKIDVALGNIASILPFIPSETKLGLRVYGHKGGFTVYQACTASEMIVSPTINSATRISNALYNLEPTGVTPITYSLKKCIESDFGNYRGKKHIVLISDGKENCDESPCKFAIDLMKRRDDIKIDVIALGIDDPEAIAQLKCTALTTSGKFYRSNTSAQLLESLKNTLNSEKEVQGQIIKK